MEMAQRYGLVISIRLIPRFYWWSISYLVWKKILKVIGNYVMRWWYRFVIGYRDMDFVGSVSTIACEIRSSRSLTSRYSLIITVWVVDIDSFDATFLLVEYKLSRIKDASEGHWQLRYAWWYRFVIACCVMDFVGWVLVIACEGSSSRSLNSLVIHWQLQHGDGAAISIGLMSRPIGWV